MSDQPLPPSPWDMVLSAIARVESRLERLVSMEVHQVDIRRLDARLDDAISDLAMERAQRHDEIKELTLDIRSLATSLRAERDARIVALEAERQLRLRSAQWTIATLLVAVGVAAAVVGVVLR